MHLIKTADLKGWILNLLGKLTTTEIQNLLKSGDLVMEGGQTVIKNLGSVLKVLNATKKTQTMNPIVDLVLSLVKNPLVNMVVNIVKNGRGKLNPKIEKILENRYELNVVVKGAVTTRVATLNEILTALANKSPIKAEGVDLYKGGQTQATFDQILKDINEIEQIARMDRAKPLIGTAVVGLGADGIARIRALLDQRSTAQVNRQKAQNKILEVTKNECKTSVDWKNLPEVNKSVILNGLDEKKRIEFLKALEAEKQASAIIAKIEKQEQENRGN
jgi:DNA-binding protein Fis